MSQLEGSVGSKRGLNAAIPPLRRRVGVNQLRSEPLIAEFDFGVGYEGAPPADHHAAEGTNANVVAQTGLALTAARTERGNNNPVMGREPNGPTVMDPVRAIDSHFDDPERDIGQIRTALSAPRRKSVTRIHPQLVGSILLRVSRAARPLGYR